MVTAWKMSVPSPAANRAMAGSKPTKRGTNTVEPKATNINCIPIIVRFAGERVCSVIKRIGYIKFERKNSLFPPKRGRFHLINCNFVRA